MKIEADKGGKQWSETEAKDDDFNIHSGAVKNMVLGQGNRSHTAISQNMDQRGGGYSSAKSGSEEMVLEGNCDQGWQLKVFSAGFGGLSLGNVSRWMDTREETIISGGLVHVGGLRKTGRAWGSNRTRWRPAVDHLRTCHFQGAKLFK